MLNSVEREREARRAAKRSCPFPHWLEAQRPRDDYIGRLARAVAREGKLPRRATIRESWRHFNRAGIDHDGITAVTDAMTEWRALIGSLAGQALRAPLDMPGADASERVAAGAARQ